MITTLSLTVLFVLLIIYIVRIYQSEKENFTVVDADKAILLDDISSELRSEMANWDSIGLPFILTDDGNFCPDWNSGASCQKLDTNYVCTIVNPIDKTITDVATATVPNPLREYCNNTLDDNIMKLQLIHVNDIISSEVMDSNGIISKNAGKHLSDFNNVSAKASDLINTLKTNNRLSTLQRYFLDNNSDNIYNKQSLIDEKNKNIDEYNNNITSSYYKYKDSQTKRDKYSKFDHYVTWALYIAVAMVIIVIVLNVLFSKVAI